MKIEFSKLAVLKLEKLTSHLRENWGIKTVNTFFSKLDSSLINIKNNPEIFACSQFDNQLRKATITKQTSILYEIQEDTIYVLNIIDNRQDPEKIFLEIKKNFG
jgi:plasmid stabilization system protein ParE